MTRGLSDEKAVNRVIGGADSCEGGASSTIEQPFAIAVGDFTQPTNNAHTGCSRSLNCRRSHPARAAARN